MSLPSKVGIWTVHEDDSGRKYYYNMVQGRSYWNLSPEVMSQVKESLLKTARQWKTELSEKENDIDRQTSSKAGNEIEENKSVDIPSDKAAGKESDVAYSSHKNTTVCLQDRIALVAQKKAEQRS
uniref:AlNc14C453G11743 protein n=1 Tax=Albugo laibachii Nc14 TaxID=890382 RepID=F0X002_9STRA|nr:AlNc14C453G11743 [Albugo laibachii Nc14]|eukprot:CCA27083.1 AlNc14C453G11743 [Albugo laibachii Nc14]